MTNFGASAALQARSIYALMLRRIRSRYKGSRAGYVWALVEPIIWVVLLKMMIRHSGNQQPPVGDSYEVFFASGIVVARTWRSSVQSILPFIVRTRKRFLPTMLRLDAAYAAWLLEVVTGGLVMVIILSGLAVFGFHSEPGNLLMCVIAFMGMALFALSFGLFLGLVLVMAPGLDHFRSLILMAMFLTSGFSFLVDRMEYNVRYYLVWNPVLHCVEWFREAFFAGYLCRSLDLVYLFGVTFTFLVIGLASERALRRKKRTLTENYDQEDELV